MAIVVRSDLSKTVSSLTLDKWSTSAHELQGIRIKKKKKNPRWETQIPDSHQCIHASLHLLSRSKLGFSWGDGRQTGRHNLDMRWFQCTIKFVGSTWHQPAGMCTRRSAKRRPLHSCVSSKRHTLGARQDDTDSTIDLGLVSPRLSPRTRAETIPSHESDHLSVVLSLQKPGFWQEAAQMTTWSQSWSSLKHFPDWARIQLLVKYSDTMNLPVDDKSELFTLYEESFATG